MSKTRIETESLHLPRYVMKNLDKIKRGSLVLNPRGVYTVYYVLYADKYSLLLMSKNGNVISGDIDKFANVTYPFIPEDELLIEESFKIKKFLATETMYNFFEKITAKKSKTHLMKEKYSEVSEGVNLDIKVYVSKYKFENKIQKISNSSYSAYNDLGSFTIPLNKTTKFYLGLKRTYYGDFSYV
jgi:hypothetical protein